VRRSRASQGRERGRSRRNSPAGLLVRSRGMPSSSAGECEEYLRRDPESGVLSQVLLEHLKTFLARNQLGRRGDGSLLGPS